MVARDTQDWPAGFSGDQERDFPYFRRLWKSIVVALLAASFIPMLVIGGGMYYYTVSIIEERTLDALRLEVKEHREAIDGFLAERTSDLKLLSSNLGLEHLTAPGNLEKVFRSLQAELPCFTDLSIIDDEGRHRAYVGPFDLLSQELQRGPLVQGREGTGRLCERHLRGVQEGAPLCHRREADPEGKGSGSSGPRWTRPISTGW